MVLLAMVVLVRCIESAEEVVGGYPPVQSFGLSRDNLNMQVAVWKLEFAVLSEVGADVLKNGTPLVFGQQSHASGGQEEDGGVLDLILGDDTVGKVDQLFQTFADLLRLGETQSTAPASVHLLRTAWQITDAIYQDGLGNL